MTVRCKMRLISITDFGHNNKKYVFQCAYDPSIPEDIRFAKASPSGNFEIYIDNPSAQEAFEINKFYYFDAVPVPEETK